MFMLKIVLKKLVKYFLLSSAIWLHSKLYVFIGVLLINEKTGSHPKHKILNYGAWFESKVKPSWNILDIGSGKGVLGYQLSFHVNKVIGIELDSGNYSLSKNRFKRENLYWVHADAMLADYSEFGKIDAVILSNVLEHISEREAFIGHLKSNIQWGHEGPCFLIRVPTIERDWLSVFKLENGYEYRLDSTHFVEYTEDQLRTEIQKAGLKAEIIERRFDELFLVAM